MDNRLSSNIDAQAPQGDSVNRKRAFWASVIFTFVAITSFIFAIFLIGRMPTWQAYAILMLTAIALVIDVIATVLILRGRTTAGLLLLYWSLLLTVPLNVLLVTNTTQYLIAIILLVGFTHVFYLQPRSWRKYYVFGPIVAAALMAMVEIYNPSFRMNVTNTTTTSSYFGPIIFSFLVVSLISLVVWQAWGGSIRLKLVTSFTVIALVSVTILGTVTYISYRNQLHEDIRQRLLNIASITATQQDGDLHASIQGPDSMEKEAYQKMAAQGLDIIRTDPEIVYLYTMRMNEQGQIYFIIDAEQGDYKAVDVGTVYVGPSDLLLENFNTLDSPVVEEDIYTDEYGSVLSAYAPIYRADGTREAIVGVDISAEKIIAQEKAVFNLILGATLATLLLVSMIGLYLGNIFTRPITNLSLVAHKIGAGDLGARAIIETSDEIGELAQSFNVMTSQLQNTLQGLEQRVTERTHNLELAAQVGRAVSQLRDLNSMLKDACELILKEFDLYYVQVYLTDPGQTILKLEAGTGDVGAQLVERGHSLPLNSGSINGRAAFEKISVVISNTTQSATFRQNPLLPDTRGEMAVPLIVGNQVVGVLDMQSNGPGVLNSEILPAFEALAGQLAVAIQNANLLAEAEQARAQLEAQARHLVRTGWNEHLDAIHKPEHIGFIYSQNQVVPMTDIDEAENKKAISVPIAVSGEPLGSLVVEINDEARREQTDELVNIVARQVAQQIENLRLLEDAERYRYEAEQATRLQTVEGWQKLIESRTGKSLGYLYDSKEVRPHDYRQDENTFTFSLPIKVHDEMIGKLAVEGLESQDQDSVELIDTVAERLSAHIENLRLFEQTQVSLAEAQSLYRINEAIGGEMDLDAIYQTVAQLSCDEMGFSGSWISVYEPEHEVLRGVAGINIPEERIFDRLPLNQNTPANFAAQTRQTVTINHPEQDERMHGIPQNVREAMGKALSTPVMIGQELFGVIAVTRPVNAADIGAREERMLQTVATQLAIVMQRVKFFDQVQKQAKRESMLNIISQKIQSATTVEAVLQIAARELGHALGAPMTIAQLSMKEKAS
jgi:GAF domain-containing protein/HAMP domain-containing protein